MDSHIGLFDSDVWLFPLIPFSIIFYCVVMPFCEWNMLSGIRCPKFLGLCLSEQSKHFCFRSSWKNYPVVLSIWEIVICELYVAGILHDWLYMPNDSTARVLLPLQWVLNRPVFASCLMNVGWWRLLVCCYSTLWFEFAGCQRTEMFCFRRSVATNCHLVFKHFWASVVWFFS